MGIKEELITIDPSKDCLKFLGERILSNNYRGIQLSQHNRYDVCFVITMLEQLELLVGTEKMQIRTTDLSKRPYNTPGEETYANYVDSLVEKNGRCTQDSVRKNLFVDLNRMGFINRYDKNKNLVLPYERIAIKYVSITNLGLELINNKDDLFKRNLIYTKAIEQLTNGLPEELIDVVSINEKITMTEFQFFISFIDQTLNGHLYTKTELISYVEEFRKMSIHQRNAVVDRVKDYCNPNNFVGNKTNLRDYHNWKNETQQIFNLLNQTVLYELRDEILYIRIGENGLFDNKAKLKRSLSEKKKYFEQQGVEKQKGFELHHIIPLLSAQTKNDFAVLDVWKNMIYIDGCTHAKITQTNNKNIDLCFDDDNIILSDPAGLIENIDCVKDTNVFYDANNKETMQEFNDSILNKHE